MKTIYDPGGNHQLRYGIGSYRHECKKPRELRAFGYDIVKERFAADHLRVSAGVAAGGAKDQLFAV